MNLKKVFKTSLLLITLLIISTPQFAQKGSRHQNKEKREKIKAQKIAFITDKLDLTTDEAEKFWPVYNANQNKLQEMHKSFHAMFEEKTADIDGLSEEESKELIIAKQEHDQKILNTRKQFNNDLESVLPQKKILILMEAEKEFKVTLMRNLSRPRGDGSGPQNGGRR